MSYLALGDFTISPDHRLLGYSLDTSGDEIYRLFVKDLGAGHIHELPFDACAGGYPVPPMPGQTLPELADVVHGTTETDDRKDVE